MEIPKQMPIGISFGGLKRTGGLFYGFGIAADIIKD